MNTAAQAMAREARPIAATRRVRSRVHTQWLALGAALVVLSGVLVAWGLSQAAERVQVVQVARDVPAGHVLEAGDLTITGVAYDGAVHGLVPAASLHALVGRVAAIDFTTGALVQVGMWSDLPPLAAGEDRVGAVLAAGRFPVGLTRGDVAVAAAIDPTVEFAPVTVRVLDVVETSAGDLHITLAVGQASAVSVGQLAATDQLLLVGRASAGES
ncbi:MAG: SAF domain-containing protein [Actinomycetota bacterium]|nr:SAF domain-containing protein [Actinomycetota bacterium]